MPGRVLRRGILLLFGRPKGRFRECWCLLPNGWADRNGAESRNRNRKSRSRLGAALFAANRKAGIRLISVLREIRSFPNYACVEGSSEATRHDANVRYRRRPER